MSCPRILCVIAVLCGCSVRPSGEQAERDRAAAAGARYGKPFAERALPALVPDAPLAAVLAHAELGNGTLEAAWQRWLAAIEQIPQASTQPTTAMIGVEHRLDGGAAIDRTGLMVATDAMNNLLWPGRLAAAGEAALARARAAGAEFDRARLRLQTEIAEAYYGLALRDEELRLLGTLRAVLSVQLPSARARLQAAGASQVEVLRAEAALDRVEAEIAAKEVGRPALVAALRRLAGLGEQPADLRPVLPDPAPLREGERAFVEQALRKSPDLAVLLAEEEAARAAVAAAEWERVPEFSLRGVVMGDAVATLSGALTLPFLRGTAIEAQIREARAVAAGAEALRRQGVHDATARVVAEVASLHAAATEAHILETRVLPRIRQAASVGRSAWVAGRGSFDEFSADATTAIDVEQRLARLRAEAAIARARLQEAVGG